MQTILTDVFFPPLPAEPPSGTDSFQSLPSKHPPKKQRTAKSCLEDCSERPAQLNLKQIFNYNNPKSNGYFNLAALITVLENALLTEENLKSEESQIALTEYASKYNIDPEELKKELNELIGDDSVLYQIFLEKDLQKIRRTKSIFSDTIDYELIERLADGSDDEIDSALFKKVLDQYALQTKQEVSAIIKDIISHFPHWLFEEIPSF